MKQNLKNLFVVGVFGLLFFTCQTPTDPKIDTSKLVVLKGVVENKITNLAIDSAVVRLNYSADEIYQITDSLGKFEIQLEAEKSTTVKMVAFKESYWPDTMSVFIMPGRTIEVPPFQLRPTDRTPNTSGQAASIVLFSQTATNVGVKESGALETATLVFEVQDSSSIPIDFKNAVNVHFKIGSGPGGGEYVYPDSVKTSSMGQARAFLSAGTKAGVVQIIAEAVQNNKIIRSKPVAIAIHGGFPDLAHFTLATKFVNVKSYNSIGIDGITVYIGDKYSNPVRFGTSVYFSTSGGIIQGSSTTNELGSASVTLIASKPEPINPQYGDGFARVVSYTVDENENTISDTIFVLFSGPPIIHIQPTTFSMTNGGTQFFDFTVSDHNENPLVQGTSISVNVEGEGIAAKGNVSETLPDTQSRAWTQFGFLLYDAAPDTVMPTSVLITIESSGDNGKTSIAILGTAE